MNLSTLLTGILTTVAGKIMVSLGVSAITYTGINILQQKFINHLVNGLNGLMPESLQLFYMAGGGVALNWVFGAITFMTGWYAVSKLGSVFSK